MHTVNRFGSGKLYSMDELIEIEGRTSIPLIYCTSTACMSVTSDMMSWWSDNIKNIDKVAFVSQNDVNSNNVIIVLGCQVTDLAVLNDIKTVERLHEQNPKASVYMGGCLAYRFDIELPEYVHRLAATRAENKELSIVAKSMVHWENPFWVKNWDKNAGDFEDGHLFRNMYPLKIGAGCSGKCKYCTIRDTRGEGYEVDAYLQVREFLNHEKVVLVSDSPTVKQIKDWCYLAERYNKSISIRNIEPRVTCECKNELLHLAELKLLDIFHCPIQSEDPELLRAMNRDVESTSKAIEIMDELRSLGTKIATNIIIDYVVNNGGKQMTYRNINVAFLNKHFDYWSWNPYFDGNWNRERAEERFARYIQ